MIHRNLFVHATVLPLFVLVGLGCTPAKKTDDAKAAPSAMTTTTSASTLTGSFGDDRHGV
jgi:hypothetical protein